jgi:thioesterase domain-containing protein
MSEIQALERLLHHDIPLTGDMGLRVRAWDNHCLRLHVPLAPNVNHKSTMFGGSLYCAAVLAGWGWLHLRLGEAGLSGGHIVIQQGQIDYPLPVAGDAMAVCENIDEALWLSQDLPAPWPGAPATADPGAGWRALCGNVQRSVRGGCPHPACASVTSD